MMRRHKRQVRSESAAVSRSHSSKEPVQLIKAFDATRPARASPLAASTIRDMPLDLVERIRSFPLFASAPDGFLVAVGHYLRPQVHAPGETILTEGDEAKSMYWLVRGAVKVTSRDTESTYAELQPGAFFGEIGILMGIPRTASIVARFKSLVVRLNKEDLRKILPDYPSVERCIREEAAERLAILERAKYPSTGGVAPHRKSKRTHDQLEVDSDTEEIGFARTRDDRRAKKRKSPSPALIDVAASSVLNNGYLNVRELIKGLPLFADFPDDILHFLGFNALRKIFPPFTRIITQGTRGREVYFITEGEVEVFTGEHGVCQGSNDDTEDTYRFKARLKTGQYFGEVATLLLSPQRTANVRSVGYVECLEITGEVLDELWRRCSTEVRKQVETTAKRRLEANRERDVTMLGAGTSNLAMDELVIGHTGNSASRQESPSSSEEEHERRRSSGQKPFDPDPFLNAEQGVRRSSRSRRTSLADINAPQETSPLAEGEGRRLSISMYKLSGFSSRQTSAPSSPTFLAARPRHKRQPTHMGQGLLPDNILIMIFNNLDVANLMRCRQISFHWSKLLSSSPDLLTVLDLSILNRKITDEALENISPFVGSRPRIVNINNCYHVTDDGFTTLVSHCASNATTWQMKSVWEVGASAIFELADVAKKLQHIDFSNCRKVNDVLLGRVIGWVPPGMQFLQAAPHERAVIGCPALKTLVLSYCKHVSDRFMAHVAAHAASRLETLDLTRCTTIGDSGFRAWADAQFPVLRKLVLADCTYLSDNALLYLSRAAPGLRELDLSFCCALSDTAIEILARGCRRLQCLLLSFCGSAVSDASMQWIGASLRDLRRLSVRGCVRVTGTGVEAVLAGCQGLEIFDVSQCKHLQPWLDAGGVERMKGRCRIDVVAR